MSLEEVSLVPAAAGDAAKLFEMRNDSAIVRYGTSRRLVPWAEHIDWYTRSVRDDRNHRIYFIQNGDDTVGVVRFERVTPRQAAISVYLLERTVGRGLGAPAIRRATQLIFDVWTDLEHVEAHVLQDNTRASKAFSKAGYRLASTADIVGHQTYIRRRAEEFLKVPHNRIEVEVGDAEAVATVVRSGHWAAGPVTQELEQRLCQVSGRQHAVVVGSGLASVRLSLLALGMKLGDDVAIPAYSCVALANAVAANGGQIVPAECGEQTANVDAAAVAATGAKIAILVNTFGIPVAEAAFNQAARVIEDCAHGILGAGMGSRGAVSVISFYATKLIGSGRGGAILTDDRNIAETVRDLRSYADKPVSQDGLNELPDDLNSALTLSRLSRLSKTLEARREIAMRYLEGLQPLSNNELFLLPQAEGERVWYRFTVQVKDPNQWIESLRTRGVEAERPVCNWLTRQQELACPIAAMTYRETLSLPLFPTLSREEVNHVVRICREIGREIASDAIGTGHER